MIENLAPDAERGAISGDPQVVRIGDEWVMFYFGAFWKPGAFDTFAVSKDLITWTKWTGEDYPAVRAVRHALRPQALAGQARRRRLSLLLLGWGPERTAPRDCRRHFERSQSGRAMRFGVRFSGSSMLYTGEPPWCRTIRSLLLSVLFAWPSY